MQSKAYSLNTTSLLGFTKGREEKKKKKRKQQTKPFTFASKN